MVRDYQMQVPFGVVSAEAGQILRLDEKPTRSYTVTVTATVTSTVTVTVTVSAGAYVFSRKALSRVPSDAYYDMPSLIADVIAVGLSVRQQRDEGYWMDIGRPPDYAQANADFGA